MYRLVDGRWVFAQKLMAPDPRPNAQFASTLAMDGEWLIVGARVDDEGGHLAGAIYIFRREPGGDFEFVRKVLAPGDPHHQVFGDAVAIEGEQMTVGAATGPGSEGNGAVYVYTLEGEQWVHTATLLHDDPQFI